MKKSGTKKARYIKFSAFALLLALVGIGLFHIHVPYRWEEKYDVKSKQPFGCYYFDRFMEHTFGEDGYEYRTELTREAIDSGVNVILYQGGYLNEDSLFDDIDVTDDSVKKENSCKLVEIVRHGGIVVLIGDADWMNRFGGIWPETRRYWKSYYQVVDSMKCNPVERKKVIWKETGEEFRVQPFMLCGFVAPEDYRKKKLFYEPLLTYTPSGERNEYLMVYADCAGGKGKKGGRFFYVCSDLLMTNYGVLDGRNVELITRILAPLKGKKVIRLVPDDKRRFRLTGDNKSLFSYLISQPPLRWALNITMISLLLFCIFSARRRMRAIPQSRKYSNSTLDFALHMGTYYLNHSRNREMAVMKYEHLLSTLQHTYRWDTENMKPAELARRISDVTFVGQVEVEEMVSTLMYVKRNQKSITRTEVVKYVGIINKIIQGIK